MEMQDQQEEISEKELPLVEDIIRAVAENPNTFSGERHVRTALRKKTRVVAYWLVPEVFGIFLYRSVGRLFARGVQKQPFQKYGDKKIYEVPVESAVDFIRERGGLLNKNEVKDAGFGTEICRISLTTHYLAYNDTIGHYLLNKYIFYEKDNRLMLCHESYNGIMRRENKSGISAFAREYQQSRKELPSVADLKLQDSKNVTVRDTDIPLRCLEFVENKSLINKS